MINPLRHNKVFSPEKFDKGISVIGIGATGSKVAMSLVKLGIEKIHAYDFDRVEEHNIPNQIYGEDQIGLQKTQALFDIIKRQTNSEISVHNEKVDGSQNMKEIVFLLTDTMSSRKLIWEKSIKGKCNLMIETRLDSDQGMIYTINPKNPKHVVKWEGTLCEDKEADPSVCGGEITVGPSSSIIAELAVWQFIKWFQQQMGVRNDLENEIIIGVNPVALYTKMF